MAIHRVETRRDLGAYYSPESLCRLLVRWAIDGKPSTVLDPSYGGCAMLRVALEELDALGAAEPSDFVFGADIDGSTATWAAGLVAQGVPAGHLIESDFLKLAPGIDLPRVSAVVGNPPYVRHHRMSNEAKASATASAEASGISLSGSASLWAYFVAHSCRFVLPGGRLAMLLPGAALQSNYSAAVVEHVRRRFRHVALVRVNERFFEGTSEETVVLLAASAVDTDSESSEEAPCARISVDGIAELELVVRSWPEATAGSSGVPSMDGVADWKLDIVGAETAELLRSVLEHAKVSSLGDVAKIRLGSVTGANDFFVVDEETATNLDVLEWTATVISRSAWIEGAWLGEKSRTAKGSAARRDRLLLIPHDVRIDGRTRLGKYIAEGVSLGLPNRHHCRREPWYSLRDVKTPDAFLPYMVGHPRGMALNCLGATSTNTVHQVTWLSPVGREQSRSWALSTWSSLGALCAELFGRHYGGGVLKLELRDAQRIPVVGGLQISQEVWRNSCGDPSTARHAADHSLQASDLGLKDADLHAFRQAASALSRVRHAQR